MIKALIASLPERAGRLRAEHRKYLTRLRDRNPKKLDEICARLHDEVFADIDCLECANCCRSISPRWRDLDIRKAAKALNMHPKTFKLSYLTLDEDEDFVCKKMPCPFLGCDNYCQIYEDRPRACAEYPHTNLKQMRGLLGVMRSNIAVCPAVFEIVERLRKEIVL